MNQNRNSHPFRENLNGLRVDRLTGGVAQAREWSARLLQEIRKIEVHLSMPNRCDSHGNRLNTRSYREWRKNATYAMSTFITNRRELESYIKYQRSCLRDKLLAVEEGDPEGLLLHLYTLNRRILSQAPNVTLNETEQGLLDMIRGRFFLFES